MFSLHKFILYFILFTICCSQESIPKNIENSAPKKDVEKAQNVQKDDTNAQQNTKKSSSSRSSNVVDILTGNSKRHLNPNAGYIISNEDVGNCPVRCKKFNGKSLSKYSHLMYLECPVRTMKERDIFYNKANIAHVQNMYSQFRNSNGKFPSSQSCCSLHSLNSHTYHKPCDTGGCIDKKNINWDENHINPQQFRVKNDLGGILAKGKPFNSNGLIVDCITGENNKIEISRGIEKLQIPTFANGRVKFDGSNLNDINTFFICPIRHKNKVKLVKRTDENIQHIVLCPIRHKHSSKWNDKVYLNHQNCLSCPIRNKVVNKNVKFRSSHSPIVCPIRNSNYLQFLKKNSDNSLPCKVKDLTNYDFVTASKRECDDLISLLVKIVEKQNGMNCDSDCSDMEPAKKNTCNCCSK